MKFVIIALFMFTGCSRMLDELSDSFQVGNNNVVSSHIECFSGGQKVFDHVGSSRVWIRDGGHYEIVKSDKLITITGDCVLYEDFK